MIRSNHSRIPHLPPDNPPDDHTPVLLHEVLDLLLCRPGMTVVDGTVGLGGHSQAILEKILPGGALIGLDRDKDSLEKAKLRLEPYRDHVRLVHDNFKNLPLVLHHLSLGPIDGIMVDLGVSSYQLLSPERGFSLQSDSMLDMRMDRRQKLTAADLVNTLPAEQLADIIYQFGEEKLSRRIAAAIVHFREQNPISRCSQLAEIVSRAVRVRGFKNTHPATRTFQALRIAVNQELEGLEDFIFEAFGFLKPGGRLAVIAFHSLEDRIVKISFKKLAGLCICERPPELCTCSREAHGRLITTRAQKPGAAELQSNPRSRSARLRVIEKQQSWAELNSEGLS
jgi:16S rRNA (cytosine1402-N4)-methyltransferase